MHITNLGKTPATVPTMAGASGVTKQVPISGRDGSPSFSFRVFTIQPGGHTPYHEHPFEHLNYIIQGCGRVERPEGALEITKGDFVLVLPGETHQYRNTSSTEPLLLLCAVPVAYE
jgi:quercetin dioxygenase-like cupin family protein